MFHDWVCNMWFACGHMPTWGGDDRRMLTGSDGGEGKCWNRDSVPYGMDMFETEAQVDDRRQLTGGSARLKLLYLIKKFLGKCVKPHSQGDPHMLGAHGDTFDFRGTDGGVYALLSARGLAVNGLFKNDTFLVRHKQCTECKSKDGRRVTQTVNGSFIKQMFITALSSDGAAVNVTIDAERP
eukprot:5465237-Pleurochrysis_carterae.AAC.1